MPPTLQAILLLPPAHKAVQALPCRFECALRLAMQRPWPLNRSHAAPQRFAGGRCPDTKSCAARQDLRYLRGWPERACALSGDGHAVSSACAGSSRACSAASSGPTHVRRRASGAVLTGSIYAGGALRAPGRRPRPSPLPARLPPCWRAQLPPAPAPPHKRVTCPLAARVKLRRRGDWNSELALCQPTPTRSAVQRVAPSA